MWIGMDREDKLRIIKRLLNEQPVKCPDCGVEFLEKLHKTRHDDVCNYRCPACGRVYRVPNMINDAVED